MRSLFKRLLFLGALCACLPALAQTTTAMLTALLGEDEGVSPLSARGRRRLRIARLLETDARIDAALELVALQLPRWQLRRIAYLRTYRGDRIRLCKFQPIDDTKALPLIAVREFIISRKSLGGIQTDLQSRVLDAAGRPIAGLYAVGEAAGFGGGGVHGYRSLEGTFLGGCLFSGRNAGRAAAKAVG